MTDCGLNGVITQVINTVDADSVASAISADGTRLAVLSTADLTGTGKNADGSTELLLVTVNNP